MIIRGVMFSITNRGKNFKFRELSHFQIELTRRIGWMKCRVELSNLGDCPKETNMKNSLSKKIKNSLGITTVSIEQKDLLLDQRQSNEGSG